MVSQIYTALVRIKGEEGAAELINPVEISTHQNLHSTKLRGYKSGSFALVEVSSASSDRPLRVNTIITVFENDAVVVISAAIISQHASFYNFIDKKYTLNKAGFPNDKLGHNAIPIFYGSAYEAVRIFSEIREEFPDNVVVLTVSDAGFFSEEEKTLILEIEKENEIEGDSPFSIVDNGWVGNRMFKVPGDLKVFFSKVAPKIIQDGRCYILDVAGPSGNGKTTFAKALAYHLSSVLGGDPVVFVKVSCPTLTEVPEIFGQMRAKDGSTFYEPSEFSKIIQEGRCVALLDEINRVPRYILSGLLNLQDRTGEVVVDGFKLIRGDITNGKDHGIIFVRTMNHGEQYAIEPMDTALANRRNGTIVINRPDNSELKRILAKKYNIRKSGGNPNITQAQLQQLIRFVNKLEKEDIVQNIDLSVRMCENVLENVDLGFTLKRAIEMIIINDLLNDKTVYDVINRIMELLNV